MYSLFTREKGTLGANPHRADDMPSTTSLAIIVFACIGSVFALYAYHVEMQLANPGYVPTCDSYGYSCSKVFTHPGGHLLSFVGLVPRHHALDFSSALLGFLFYAFTIVLALAPTNVGDASERRSRRLLKAAVQQGSALFSGFITVFMFYGTPSSPRLRCT